MPANYVQELCRGGGTGASTVVTNVSANATAGNLAVMVGGDQTAVPTSITDTKGNTWTIDESGTGGTMFGFVASTPMGGGVLTTTDTITITWAAAQTRVKFTVDEFTGVDTSSTRVRNHSSAAIATGTGRTSASVSANAGDLIFGGFLIKGSETSFVAGSGYTAPASSFNAGTGCSVAREYQVAPSTTSYSPDGTGGVSAAGWGVAVVYKAAATGSPQTVPVSGVSSAGAAGVFQSNMSFGVSGLSSAGAFGTKTYLTGPVTIPVGSVPPAGAFGSVGITGGSGGGGGGRRHRRLAVSDSAVAI